ncbi:Hypothetical predicted protein, partial [Paramuricea clavata]
MSGSRQRYCRIPKLCSLVKRARSNCWGCKRSQAKPWGNPATGPLPSSKKVAERKASLLA